MSRNIFGTSFFTLTGFHGLHVLLGLLALASFWRDNGGDFQTGPSNAIRQLPLLAFRGLGLGGDFFRRLHLGAFLEVDMTAWQLFVSGWDWEPSVIVGCAALLLSYFAALRFSFQLWSSVSSLGSLVLLLALVSPLDTLADNTFSARICYSTSFLFSLFPLC